MNNSSFFQSPRTVGGSADDGVIPLINIVFLMLVFFMVAGNVAMQDPAPFEAPDSRSQHALRESGHTLLMAVDGSLWFDGEKIDALSGLRGLGIDERSQLAIKADAQLPASRLDELLEALRNAGVRQLQLAVEVGSAE